MAAKKTQYHTPICLWKYCHLNKPDTKFNEFGIFSINAVMDREDAGVPELLAKLDALLDIAYAEAEDTFKAASGQAKGKWKENGITKPKRNPAYAEDFDDDGNPTGRVVLYFKTNATFKDRATGEMKTKQVKLADGRGNVIKANKRPMVYGGTSGRIAFTTGSSFIPKDADVYLSLYLNEAQITDLVTGGGSTSSFGAVEGSDFDADELDEFEAGSTADSDDQSDLPDDLDDEIPF